MLLFKDATIGSTIWIDENEDNIVKIQPCRTVQGQYKFNAISIETGELFFIAGDFEIEKEFKC